MEVGFDNWLRRLVIASVLLVESVLGSDVVCTYIRSTEFIYVLH